MKVKKRTVWFMTLFSLAAVISVFYLFDPTRDISLQTIFSNSSLDDISLTEKNGGSIPVTTDSHYFEQLRIELSNERSKLREQYMTKIASDQISADEKNETFNLLNYLIEQESSEVMVETHLKAMGYADAFVKIDEDKINVTIMSDELSKEKVNEIVYLVKTEVNEGANVVVNYKSEYY